MAFETKNMLARNQESTLRGHLLEMGISDVQASHSVMMDHLYDVLVELHDLKGL